MQYVRNLSDSVSTAWNSINPATLSGAIDVIVVEQADGSLACSPFHVRFGKFSLLRPSDKKVQFEVNGVKQDYSMKLGEGGEAFFVFETTGNIPRSLQTSPLVSPASSPPLSPQSTAAGAAGAYDPANDPLDLDATGSTTGSTSAVRPAPAVLQSSAAAAGNGLGLMTTPATTLPTATTASNNAPRPISGDWSVATAAGTQTIYRPQSDDALRYSARSLGRDGSTTLGANGGGGSTAAEDATADGHASERSQSPPPLPPKEAIERATMLSRELSTANIPTKITDTGDLMLDMTGFKSSEQDMIRAEVFARKVLAEELDGNYDIGSLFGFDAEGNLWIYSSEEARKAAMAKTMECSMPMQGGVVADDAVSDPGYQSDTGADDGPSSAAGKSSGGAAAAANVAHHHRRSESDSGPMDVQGASALASHHRQHGSSGDPNRNYAKTLRLTSDQLRALSLKPGPNSMSFTVNRATCSANMYLWRHETPVVISDIDGTITKSDALGHVLNMIGRDWTHGGVAKLYSDIEANGYNIMYLTSRSVGQSDTTRAYLANISQDGYRMPLGPTILSPDRTMAALRREIYLRQPQVFKMATLRDIRNLYTNPANAGANPGGTSDEGHRTPFYAGFGNRLTDQISYRTVDVPRNRIFTINSNSEVSLDLLTLNKLRMTYVNINEVVDHYFPPVSTLVIGGGEDFTDFKYWRDDPLALDDFSASDTDDDDDDDDDDNDEADVDDQGEPGEDEEEDLEASYLSRDSYDDSYEDEVDDDEVDDEEDEEDEDQGFGRPPSSEAPIHKDDKILTDEDDDSDEADAMSEDVNAELIAGVSHKMPCVSIKSPESPAANCPAPQDHGGLVRQPEYVQEPVEIRPPTPPTP